MKIKSLLIVFLICMVNFSCEKESENNEIAVETGVRLSYLNKDNIDLLNPNNNVYTDIKVYQIVDGEKIPIDYTLADPEMTTHEVYYLGFLMGSKDAYYIQLKEEETDTVVGVVEQLGNSTALVKIIYNGVEKTLEDSTGIYKIIK